MTDRYLVTGAAGFVGSTICRRLAAAGVETVGVDCFTDYYDTTQKKDNLATIEGERFRFVDADLTATDLPALLDGVTHVVHQAGQPGVRSSWGEEFAVYTRNNVELTQRLLEVARTSDTLQRFVYASSSSVYGDAERYPTLETDLPRPVSPYGVTKLAAEHLCTLYASNFGVPTVSLRYFTVYGPRQRPDMAFTRFVRAGLLGEPITVFGTGEQVRDFTYVDDIVEANLLAADRPSPPGTVLNISGGSSVSLNEALAVLERVVGRELQIVRHDRTAGDVFRTGGDASRAAEVLGWRPAVTLEEGLAAQAAWMRGVLGAS
ncbi:NAD-dependent epimerase/dehydratase family protein [Actinomycetospora straminea]|uniref:NAD-dependent epimerase/dehydratase family protein n=1 Tax=Actinomycetospora straminea TaxID=663607 RepID=A0ABP9E5S3_9PSEU|nr:NAD-dependent epimerase/dehydratase family protein [Actinomycetospora straminea]MDD7931116.1 NAD-dependent epimerase/dehydratase family protein [Actinomycetospora straminea]